MQTFIRFDVGIDASMRQRRSSYYIVCCTLNKVNHPFHFSATRFGVFDNLNKLLTLLAAVFTDEEITSANSTTNKLFEYYFSQ